MVLKLLILEIRTTKATNPYITGTMGLLEKEIYFIFMVYIRLLLQVKNQIEKHYRQKQLRDLGYTNGLGGC